MEDNVLKELFKISKVSIFGMWGNKDIKVDLSEKDNVLIGTNGSGKTTFINIVESILKVDLTTIKKLKFNKVILNLIKGEEELKIIFNKRKINDGIVLEYNINNEIFSFNNSDTSVANINNMENSDDDLEKEKVNKLKDILDEIVKVRGLTVYRFSYNSNYRPILARKSFSEVDRKLNNLLQDLDMLLREKDFAQKRVNKLFEKDVLLSILYDDKLDYISSMNDKNNWEQEKETLIQVYRELGFYNDAVEEKIRVHFERVKEASKKYERGNATIEELIPLTLLNRTEHILKLSMKVEGLKQEIYKPIEEYLKVLNGFFKDTNKEFKINERNREMNRSLRTPLLVKGIGGNLDIFELSSGEKQLLILLTETLMQLERQVVFIADEPELSLHISWQEKILQALRVLNKNAQIIVATHSPEIAGSVNESSLIDMEDIVYNE